MGFNLIVCLRLISPSSVYKTVDCIECYMYYEVMYDVTIAAFTLDRFAI